MYGLDNICKFWNLRVQKNLNIEKITLWLRFQIYKYCPKPYINGNMIYSAFRWCINLNLNRMTGFVLQGHMLIFTRAASLHYINTCHNCVLNIECILPDLFTCCKYKHIYNKWQNTLVYKIQSIKVFIISYKVLLFKQVNHLNESCIV